MTRDSARWEREFSRRWVRLTGRMPWATLVCIPAGAFTCSELTGLPYGGEVNGR